MEPEWIKFMGSQWIEWRILDALAPIILETIPGCVVDIGIGNTTQILSKHAATHNKKQYSIDPSERKCQWAKSLEAHSDHIICQCISKAFMRDFKTEPIALVLIDGCHKASLVEAEARFFIDHLSPNGVIFMHDTCPPEKRYKQKQAVGRDMDTWKARKALEGMEGIDVFTWRYHTGFTMVLKKDMNEPFYRL